MTTNNTIQNLSDEELARLSDDKNIAELGEVNDEVEKTNNTLVQDAPEDKPEQDVLDEKEDNKFIEETEDELDLGINEAILDLASDDDGEVE
jgi:hypothetical protein